MDATNNSRGCSAQPQSSMLELPLSNGLNTEGSLHRMRVGDVLRFSLNHSLAGQHSCLLLHTNHPPAANTAFSRTAWRRLAFTAPHPFDSFDACADLPICQAGCFDFRLLRPAAPGETKAAAEPAVVATGSFVVEPQLPLSVPLQGLRVQTYLTKCLGPLTGWMPRLSVAADCGYSMIHFTPLQELGYSQSAYSLRDQLKPNPAIGADWPAIASLIARLQQELGLLSMADLVYNHSANDSPWLAEHPECAYNLVNSPHLRPAYLVDRAIVHWSDCIARGDFAADGLRPEVTTEEQLEKARHKLHAIVDGLNIADFYLCHVDNLVGEFSAYLVSGHCPTTGQLESLTPELLQLMPDPAYRRHGCRVRLDLAAKYHYLPVRHMPCSVDRAAASLHQHLDYLNAERAREITNHLNAAVDNAIAGARYRFVNPSGERLGRVTADSPMVWNYFLHQWSDVPLSSCEREVMDRPERAVRVMAHNGWVMNDDPMRNFAEQADCNVFLRRELIVWGDSVKLRYGQSAADCPFLWQHMAEYTERTARMFHAVRLDNCHSTPLHVAQHMLDLARAVRPDLYVTGELFTGSERLDNIFISRLGISSCIREGLSAWSPFELGRQVYNYGGPPVGDLQRERSHLLCSAVSRALLFDATHDNPSPVEARSAHNLLPAAALVAMAACATGSNRGCDELVPHHIHVVRETRLYQTAQQVKKEPAVTKGKRILNQLHAYLAAEGFDEQFVDQVTDSVVAVTRHNPSNHQSVILVAHTAFSPPSAEAAAAPPRVPPLPISGSVREVIFELTFSQKLVEFVRDPDVINGLSGCSLEVQEHVPLEKSRLVAFEGGQLHFKHLPPGAVVAIRVLLDDASERACFALKQTLLTCESPETGVSLMDAVAGLDAHQLSYLLFRCAAEEGGAIYYVPDFGDLVYCGLHRLGRLMREVNLRKDLGHPVCGNLRQGDWLPDYVLGRIDRCGFAPKLSAWLSEYLKAMRQIPRYLIPSYFGSAIIRIHDSLLMRARQVLLAGQPTASRLLFCLSLGSLQFVGNPPDSALPPLAPALASQLPPLSIAAGFPHFAAGLFRNWGRDTFISLRGLLLLTGRWADARSVLLAYAGALRHGLIPNLCGGGFGARFNCRDAVWYWLHCVCEFAASAPSGLDIFADPVLRLFPSDDSPPVLDCVQPLHQVMQEALQRHADGIDFVERNAGPQLDSHMRPEGFRVTAGLRWPFVQGGSRWNCGTWMDKMGSSERAGNRGVPATPRHGCAVELSGLCAGVVRHLAKFPRSAYPHDGVTHGGHRIDWASWAADLTAQFEPQFWLPEPGHYRDRWLPDTADDPEGPQLRPNFLVAMVTAPFLFTPERARAALDVVQRRLLGPLGMRTLDPADPAYRGRYDNSDDSDDSSVAGGFAYHNGPEWLWPVGYYLRARLAFSESPVDQAGHVQAVLARCLDAMEASDWHSLPELTNRDGEPCPHSCQAQAWSMATLFEAACDLRNLPL